MGVLKLWQWAHETNIENANLINIQAFYASKPSEEEDKRKHEKLHKFLIY